MVLMYVGLPVEKMDKNTGSLILVDTGLNINSDSGPITRTQTRGKRSQQ